MRDEVCGPRAGDAVTALARSLAASPRYGRQFSSGHIRVVWGSVLEWMGCMRFGYHRPALPPAHSMPRRCLAPSVCGGPSSVGGGSGSLGPLLSVSCAASAVPIFGSGSESVVRSLSARGRLRVCHMGHANKRNRCYH